MRATALDCLLAGASHPIGKGPRGRTVVPEFMPKRNSAPIGNSSQTANDAARLEIGEEQVPGRLVAASCFGIDEGPPVADYRQVASDCGSPPYDLTCRIR